MRKEVQMWHNDCIMAHQAIMFDTLIHKSNIVDKSVQSYIFEDESGIGESVPYKGFIAAKEVKDRLVKYFILEELFDSLPIKVNETQELYLKKSVSNKMLVYIPVNPIKFTVNPEKTFESVKEFIDFIAPFEHTNPDGWTFLKFLGVMGIVGKTFTGIATKSEFGKSGLFKLFHGLTGLSITYKPRTEAGVLIQINETGNMVFDEVCNYNPEVKRIIGGFTFEIADNSPTYINGAIKAKGLKQIYNITDQSVTFLYNVLSQYDDQENFFDNMFENNPAIHSRILKLKFDGKLQEGFRKDFSIPQIAIENQKTYIDVLKMILWLKKLKKENKYQRKYETDESIGRHGLIYDEITWLIDMYSESLGEYKRWIRVLDVAVLDYKSMMGEAVEYPKIKEEQKKIKEEFVGPTVEWDDTLKVYQHCSVDGCDGFECNLGKLNKPYCKKHWNEK